MGYPKSDLSGRRFGKLLVTNFSRRTKRGYAWFLQCDCGNIVERTTGELNKGEKNGVKQACSRGCSQTIDLTEKRFGFLTAIQKSHKTKRGWYWEFECDCGNHIIKNGAQAQRGQGALHCGCKRFQGGSAFINLSGKRFGKLVVKEQTKSTNRGHAQWNCLCDCGNYIIVTGATLRRRKTHCGCERKTHKENHSFEGYEGIYRSYWTSVESGAKARDIIFELTIEQAWEIFEKQNGKCALTGVPLIMTAPYSGRMTASLDRVDSTRGYVYDNVQWVHKRVNTMKMNYTEAEFLDICKRVYEHRIESSV